MRILICIILEVIFISNNRKLLAYNVALRTKSNFICKKNHSLTAITDGKKDVGNFVNYLNSCKSNKFWIEITFKESAVIHFVALYAAYCSGDGRDVLDYFQVELIRNTTNPCGYYQRRCVALVEMRVNCRYNYLLTESVMISSHENPYPANAVVKITEVEAHSIESINSNMYIGCFPDTMSYVNSTYGSDDCRKNCLLDKMVFAFIKGDDVCGCGMELDKDELSPEMCDKKCSGGGDVCGGSKAFSVYTVTVHLPHFLGCRQITNKGGIVGVDLQQNVIKCLRHCSSQKHFFVFIKDECYCSDVMIGNVASPDLCDVSCKQDKGSTCGGKADHFSFYSGCHYNACQILFKCKDDKMDAYGRCLSGCQKPWAMPHCVYGDFDDPTPTTTTDITTTDIYTMSETQFPELSTNWTERLTAWKSTKIVIIVMFMFTILLLSCMAVCYMIGTHEYSSSD